MFCDSSDTTVPSCRLACFENTRANRSTYFGQTIMSSHVYQINVQIFKLSIKWTPGMFCDSNDTTLTSCGLTCFENTHANRSTYFGQKSGIPHVQQINVQILKLSGNGPRGC